MTSVPKPLKLLRPHYDSLKLHFDALPARSDVRTSLADVISVLAMTSAPEGSRDCLNYKLRSNTTDVSAWGHEYIRHLAGEIAEEYEERQTSEEPKPVEDLMKLVHEIVPWNMTHNAEPEAVDLCLEVEQLDLIIASVDETNCTRTCLYLLACAAYLAEPDDAAILSAAYRCYDKVGRKTDAMRVALRMGHVGMMASVLGSTTDVAEKKQLAHMLGEGRVFLDLEEGDARVDDYELRESLALIMGYVVVLLFCSCSLCFYLPVCVWYVSISCR